MNLGELVVACAVVLALSSCVAVGMQESVRSAQDARCQVVGVC